MFLYVTFLKLEPVLAQNSLHELEIHWAKKKFNLARYF